MVKSWIKDACISEIGHDIRYNSIYSKRTHNCILSNPINPQKGRFRRTESIPQNEIQPILQHLLFLFFFSQRISRGKHPFDAAQCVPGPLHSRGERPDKISSLVHGHRCFRPLSAFPLRDERVFPRGFPGTACVGEGGAGHIPDIRRARAQESDEFR